jgi:hypothetical protein
MSRWSSRTRAIFSAAICLAASGAPVAVRAEEPVRTVVVIAQRDADPITERALDAIGAGLTDLPIALAAERVDGWDDAIANRVARAREVASRTHAIAVVWLDLSAPQHVFLFISDPAGGRILVRNVSDETQDIENQLETLSLIVRSSVKGLLAGGEIGVQLPPPPPPKQPEPDHERLGVSLGYALQLYAPTDPVVHGARIELNAALARWLYVFAAYRLDIPVKSDSHGLDVELWLHPLELGLFGRMRFAKWSLDAGLFAVVDIVTFDVASSSASVEATAPDPEATFGISPFLRIARRLSSSVALYFSVGMDVVAYNNRYVVESTGGASAVVTPWRLRPMFELGARFTLL